MDRVYLPFYRSFMIKDKGEKVAQSLQKSACGHMSCMLSFWFEAVSAKCRVASMQCVIACSCGCQQICQAGAWRMHYEACPHVCALVFMR